jgi:hypothetical protein
MKLLHILKSKPDDNTKTLMDIVSAGKETTVIELYEDEADYEKLIDLVFEHDHNRVISWW